ncbi:hypothetical protein DPMN_103730 [Dreissena polymorpha]|uniref:Uncharacterized protein n=1 Tax=Dreissena polymorpha TaxID=45954 RepID=A0A9D4HBM0_DREPO|nr:hypothetical protein DPMN_103730 [Dreissena polymorpha]
MKEKAHYGPRKIVFRPFLYLESEGLSFEMLMQGLAFFNAQVGITNLSLSSQGVCICGAEGEENTRVGPSSEMCLVARKMDISRSLKPILKHFKLSKQKVHKFCIKIIVFYY